MNIPQVGNSVPNAGPMRGYSQTSGCKPSLLPAGCWGSLSLSLCLIALLHLLLEQGGIFLTLAMYYTGVTEKVG